METLIEQVARLESENNYLKKDMKEYIDRAMEAERERDDAKTSLWYVEEQVRVAKQYAKYYLDVAEGKHCLNAEGKCPNITKDERDWREQL